MPIAEHFTEPGKAPGAIFVIRNFKRFDDVAVALGEPVVLIGPNNSGKTTALQALALWDVRFGNLSGFERFPLLQA